MKVLGVDWDVPLQMDSTEVGVGLDGSERREKIKKQLLEKLTMKNKSFLNYFCHFV